MFRDEARDPERTIPRATYDAVILIGAFYAITVSAFVVAIGPDQVSDVAQKTLAGEGNILLDTAGDMLGTVGREPPSFSSLVQTVTAAIIVAVLAILGIAPLVGVFG